MPDWKCTRCGAINLEGQRLCEACGQESRSAAPRGGHVVKAKPLPSSRPCTDEQNRQAAGIMLKVYRGECSTEEGKRRLAELFQMPELEHEA